VDNGSLHSIQFSCVRISAISIRRLLVQVVDPWPEYWSAPGTTPTTRLCGLRPTMYTVTNRRNREAEIAVLTFRSKGDHGFFRALRGSGSMSGHERSYRPLTTAGDDAIGHPNTSLAKSFVQDHHGFCRDPIHVSSRENAKNKQSGPPRSRRRGRSREDGSASVSP